MESILRIDEAYNRNGKKVRVKKVMCYNDKTYLINNYYIFYDEAEVYHVEDSTNGKIVYTFNCNSLYKARNKAISILKFIKE